MEAILTLILAISLEVGVPPNFVLAIALTENTTLNPRAINHNRNGTTDHGVMQLNSAYFSHINMNCPEANIRTGVTHIKWLLAHPNICTYWTAALSYNAGTSWLRNNNPPMVSITYASVVMRKWAELEGGNVGTFINKERYR